MKYRCLSLLLAFATISAAAGTNHVFRVAADRPGAVYKPGETVTFVITLSLDEQPAPEAVEVAWTLTKDGVPPTTNGRVRLVNGRATVTGSLGEPGFLQCRAGYRGSNGLSLSALGGAAIDPLRIRPSLPVPGDFNAFWAGQKKKLQAIPPVAHLTPVPWSQPDIECFDVQIDCLGPPVSGYMARPVGAKPKSLPILLYTHGAGVRSSGLGGTASWAKNGMLAMDINAHGLPNGKPDEFYKALNDGEYKEYRTRGRESRETVVYLGMFLRLVRALDFLTAQPEWDGRTVIVHGTSQGGYQSIVAAGLDPRVSFFAAGVPAGCDHTGFKVGRINGWPKFIATGEDPPPNVVEAVRYFDAVNFAARAKAPGIVTVGFIDTTCPPTGVYAAYNALSGRKQIFDDIPTGHANSPEAMKAMREAILAHAAAQKTAVR
ncbi:MAG: acetylxylan esterase [Verrucomicrobia bacterium]|nr:acetylxylan esterase [Verrucomicrobiota bacterium]